MSISKERLLNLALERLQDERARIDSEIAEIQVQLKAGIGPASQKTTPRKRKRRSMSAEQRKAISERMKQSWAKRKKEKRKG